MSRYILSPLAIQDLDTTYDYIASNNLEAIFSDQDDDNSN